MEKENGQEKKKVLEFPHRLKKDGEKDFNKFLNDKDIAFDIDVAIEKYTEWLREINIDDITKSGVLGFFSALKRKNVGKRPYKDVTWFEATSRIMTDLVILAGVKELLETEISGLKKFDEYRVEYGNEDLNDHDITVVKGETLLLIGEAYNASESLFDRKTNKSKNKLNKTADRTTPSEKTGLNIGKKIIKILIHNYKPNENGIEEEQSKTVIEEDNGFYHVKVNIDEFLKSHSKLTNCPPQAYK